MGGGKGRAPCCDKNNVKKGPWSPTEDLRLAAFIQKNGHANWRSLPKQAGLARCGKSCRLRWINYLSPNVKRGNFTLEEEETIIKLHSSYGNKWSKIASELPGRTDNEIKNVWNTHLKKRVTKRVSENCHKDDDKIANTTSTISTSSPSLSSSSNVSSGDRNVNKELNDEECGNNMVEEIMTNNNHPNVNKQKQTSRSSSFSSNVSNASNLSSSSRVDIEKPNDEMESMISYEVHGEVYDASNVINNELFLDLEFDKIWKMLEDLENTFDETPNEELVDSMQTEWLRYLENNDHGEIIGEDKNNTEKKVVESGLEEMSSCLPLWPPSPHNFNI